MKAHSEMEVQLNSFLTSETGESKYSASGPVSFTPRKKAPGDHDIGG
jgi:hypothetical protein